LYLEDVIKELRGSIEDSAKQLTDLSLLLQNLQTPFGAWGTSGVSVNLPFMAPVDRYMHTFDPYAAKVDDLGERLIGRTVKWDNASFLAILAYFLLTLLVLFIRPDFVNLMIVGVAYIYLVNKGYNGLTYKLLCLATLASILLDLIWIFMYAGHWMGSSGFAGGAEDGVKRFSAFMSIVLLIAKLPIAVIFWRTSLSLSFVPDK
jgi:hypothetical protein